MIQSRRVFILGGHVTKFIGARHPEYIHKRHPEFGRKTNRDLESYISEAVNKTLEVTNVAAEQIDKAWIGNFAGELFSKQVRRVWRVALGWANSAMHVFAYLYFI